MKNRYLYCTVQIEICLNRVSAMEATIFNAIYMPITGVQHILGFAVDMVKLVF